MVQADPEVNRAYLGSGDVDLRRKLQAATKRTGRPEMNSTGLLFEISSPALPGGPVRAGRRWPS